MANEMLVSCLIVLCAVPVVFSSRPLSSVDSRELFHKLGFDASLYKFHLKTYPGSSLRLVPSGPSVDPNYQISTTVVSDDREESPQGVPIYKNEVGSSFWDVPSGPAPDHNHKSNPVPSEWSDEASFMGTSLKNDVGSSPWGEPSGPALDHDRISVAVSFEGLE